MRILFFGLLSFLFVLSPVWAQPGLPKITDYVKPETYEIGGIVVTGTQYSDAAVIQAIFGLKVGQEIRIPGSDIDRGIRALWKLRLFTNIEVFKQKTTGKVVFLEIKVIERSNMTSYRFTGVRKGQHEDLTPIVNRYLLKGSIVTEGAKQNAIAGIEKHYRDKGFLDAKALVLETIDTSKTNAVKLVFDVKRGKRVRINHIYFTGNTVKSYKLRGKMKETRSIRRPLASSKMIADNYEADKVKVVQYLNTLGHHDAIIKSDSVWRDKKGRVNIQINLVEGPVYYYRNIAWKGNTLHDSKTLNSILGVKSGDVYNQELLQKRISFSEDGRDVSSLYMDDGYLFFQVDPVEVRVEGDSIDLELRMMEGPQATIDRVTIAGNDRTHEHVIRRELYTKPGQKFSRTDIIRTQRQIANLGYFNQENIGINTPVNRERGTVDIEYTVEEKPSDNFEVSAGWGGFGLIGTLGVSFNNFSLRNIPKRSTWNPLPQGDGQRLSVRGQTNGRFFQAYNLSFTEPWLGGKKPNSLSVGGAYTRYADGNFFSGSKEVTGYFAIWNVFTNFGTRLKWPDDNFIYSASLEYQLMDIKNYTRSLFVNLPVSTGQFNNLSLTQSLTRSTVSDPMYPRSGSTISMTLSLTPPYSAFNGQSYEGRTIEEKFKWMEYHKWRMNAEWYVNPWKKLVIRSTAKMGLMGGYNSAIGAPPFERFVLGGDGLTNQNVGLTGFDIISSRGYETGQFEASKNGGTVFNKFSVQARYPLSLNPSSTIYAHAFVEGSNSWIKAKDYNPFQLKRSAGVGLRVFLPMFGLLGFDYGFGIDRTDVAAGSRLTSYGDFNIILGFEPD
jgi:outer membrane protein insertion porin family